MKYFNINYEFKNDRVHQRIEESLRLGEPEYVCVADGNVLTTVNRSAHYRSVVDGALFSVCDSSWVPLYLRWIYGVRYDQYSGAEIFRHYLEEGHHRMYFLGGDETLLKHLKASLSKKHQFIEEMTFSSLPFCSLDEFDYKSIAAAINADGADIIWVSLGAPKQEEFMSRLRPYLRRGVMISVGAVFKFYAGVGEKRAPEWMVRHHLEFFYRLLASPRKQANRCLTILRHMPVLLWQERRRKLQSRQSTPIRVGKYENA